MDVSCFWINGLDEFILFLDFTAEFWIATIMTNQIEWVKRLIGANFPRNINKFKKIKKKRKEKKRKEKVGWGGARGRARHWDKCQIIGLKRRRLRNHVLVYGFRFLDCCRTFFSLTWLARIRSSPSGQDRIEIRKYRNWILICERIRETNHGEN